VPAAKFNGYVANINICAEKSQKVLNTQLAHSDKTREEKY
jgi:hypothetical protein